MNLLLLVSHSIQPGLCPPPPPRKVEERVTYHIRFRRGWMRRIQIEVETVVRTYPPGDGGPTSRFVWRKPTDEEIEEIMREYFQPENPSAGRC